MEVLRAFKDILKNGKKRMSIIEILREMSNVDEAN
jgi:hypothetical protein